VSGTLPAYEPDRRDAGSRSIELVIDARPRDVGGLVVRRALPSANRLVGPFIFFDHLGPAEVAPGAGFDVRPHPHIGLATVTYLFEGEIVHRDSLGCRQPIRPGDVNWMVAGGGVAHSERSSDETRARGQRLHGVQSWVALPLEDEGTDPRFDHHPAPTIPRQIVDGSAIEVLAGTAYGKRSPVSVLSPTLYAQACLAPGARLPVDDEHQERGIYVVEGGVDCDGQAFDVGALIVLRPAVSVTIQARGPTRIMLLGGAKLAGERHVWWNFVASTRERIERAREDWRSGRFPKVVGDEDEFIPLPG
jgi:redox-sensitive bicupin YhaK (pirin superfamily)